MNVIRHQAVRVQETVALLQAVAQENQINQAIGIVSEAGTTVVSSLDDMQRNIGKDKTRQARHSSTTNEESAG